MKGFPTLRHRERRLVLVVGVLIGCWAFVSFVAQPLWDESRDWQQRLERQTVRIETIRRLVGQAPVIDRRYRQISGYLETLQPEVAERAFLDALSAICRESGLQPNFKPRGIKREGQAARVAVEVDVEGSQPQILEFVDRLLRLPRLTTIEQLRMSVVPGKSGLLRANVILLDLVQS